MFNFLFNNIKDIIYILIIFISTFYVRDYYVTKNKLELSEINEKVLTIQNENLKERQELIDKYNHESNKLEIIYNDQIKELDTKNNDLISNLNDTTRLLDKAKRSNANNQQNNNSSSSTSITGSESGIELSNEASSFLFRLTNEADKDRAALNLCKDWIRNLQKANK